MRFVCKLVEEDGVAVETAATYFSHVQGWHGREYGVKLAGGLKLTRLPDAEFRRGVADHVFMRLGADGVEENLDDFIDLFL